MNIFTDVCVAADSLTLWPATQALLRRAQALGLLTAEGFPHRWSLAELRPDEEDFAWLTCWARFLCGRQVRRALRPYWADQELCGLRLSTRQALGSLLLLLASEAARREASEGTVLWPAVRHDLQGRLRFEELCDPELFARGHPTRAHKDALEAAARRLRLRHAFDLDGVMSYFASVSLQFGFTLRGCRARLHCWLAGAALPDAVERLCELDGPFFSDSFETMWRNLICFRHNRITEVQLRDHLGRCPWILPQWIDELILRCRQSCASVTGGGATPPADAVPPLGEGRPFLGDSVLEWHPPAPPRFFSPFAPLGELNLTGEGYRVVVAGRRCGIIRRQADGSYRARLTNSERESGLELPIQGPAVSVCLVDDDDEVADAVTLSLWDTGADVNVFEMHSGQRLEEPSLRPERQYALLVSGDLQVTPMPAQWSRFPDGRILYLLEGGWPSNLSARAGEEVVWEPQLEGASEPPEPAWARDLTVRPLGGAVRPGEHVRLTIEHRPDVSVRFVRVNGMPINFQQMGDSRTDTDPAGPVDASWAAPSLEVCLGLARRGREVRVLGEVEVQVEGAARLNGAWQPLRGTESLTVDQCRLSPFRVWPPQPEDGERNEFHDWAVLEGDTVVARLTHQPRPLPGLAGLGAPLVARWGPYNNTRRALPLAREVLDTGVLGRVFLDQPHQPHTIRLELTTEAQPGPQHRIVWWDAGGISTGLVPVLLSGAPGQPPTWQAEAPADAEEPLAVAVAYNGTRVGLWWRSNWGQALTELRQPIDETAALLRWLRPPLLSSEVLAYVRNFALRSPAEVLSAWLADEPPPNLGLTWRLREEGWPSVMRTIFRDWQPNDEVLNRLLDFIDRNSEISPALVPLALELSHFDPLLMGRVVRCFITSHSHHHGIQNSRTFLRNLAQDILGQAGDSLVDDWRGFHELLVTEAAGAIGHPAFVNALLREGVGLFNGALLGQTQQDNLDLAMANVEPFRRALSLSVLMSLYLSL